METKLIIIQILTGALGSVGFSLIYRLKTIHIPLAALGGAITWGVYLLGLNFTENIFVASLIAAVICTLYAEISAKVQKTPATVLLIPSMIPLIPGGALYYTMSNIVSRELETAWYFGRLTIQYALAIALGMALVWTVWTTVTRVIQKEA
ncbi:MAG: threonine/serine exporter family protein [Clostridia bacterium]|nr:threonine/serine exporter family protein [Clostridia bacterium]MBR5991930.1 threonine/serine exporter family protein [Clostridia bacterium]MBR6478987.1 threonine/serine exporter family protein [Clostridia bacterium]